MLKVQLRRVTIRTRVSWYSEGSVMAGTIGSGCTGATSHLEIESDDDPALIAALIHNARGGCYAEAALAQPVPVSATASLNGQSLDYASYPTRPPRRRA